MQRGDYGRNRFSTLLFSLGTAASAPISYWLITKHPLGYLGVPRPPLGHPPTIEVLGHAFPRLPFLMAALPAALHAKHILWMNTWLREKFTWQFAFFGFLSHIIYDGVTALVFSAASVNPLFSERRFFYPGATLYLAAIAFEFAAEMQRVSFKRDPRNAGKPCTTGFWAITRHINYTANVVYGFAYGLAAGGPVYACLTAGMYLSNFVTNAMPSLEKYCRERYGAEWVRYEREVPWQLIPGIY
jgi:protein-S-isoprenylcysteine O-methyltransferase Ste14